MKHYGKAGHATVSSVAVHRAGSGGTHASTRRLARGSIFALATYGIGAAFAYCSQLVVARLLGAAHYGIYAYVLAWINVFSFVSPLGFDLSLLRLLPVYKAKHCWALARGIIRYAERWAITAALAAGAIGTVAVIFSPGRGGSDLTATFLIGFLVVPFWALLKIRCSIVRAFDGVVSALAPDRLVRDGALIVILGAASWALRDHVDAPFVMGATLFSTALALVLVSFAKRRLTPTQFRHAGLEYAAPAWRRTVLPILVTILGLILINKTGVVLVGWLVNTTDAGIYSLAFNVAFLVTLPRTAVDTLFAPVVSDLFARGDRQRLQALTAEAAVWTLGGAIGGAVFLTLLGSHILDWFGPDFARGISPMRILLLGQVVAASAGSQPALTMMMMGYERDAAIIAAGSAIANIGLCASLTAMFELTGAAVATSLTLVGWNTLQILYLWRKLDLIPGVFAGGGLLRNWRSNSPAEGGGT